MADEPIHPCIIVDAFENPWGPFDNAMVAVQWAQRKWPDGKQEVDWDVWALRSPHELSG